MPQSAKEWVKAREDAKGTRPRRNPAAHVAKSKLTARITAAEKHAYGFGAYDYRPEEISEIIAGYQGFGAPLPTPEQVEICDRYVERLSSLPKADRSFAAWRLWADAREAGRLSA